MRIACIIDSLGKVQQNRINILKKIVPCILEEYVITQKIDFNKYDVIYFANAGLYKFKPISHPRICAAITSHKEYGNLSQFHKISVNNKILYNKYQDKHPVVKYIPNGVNVNVYKYAENDFNFPLRIGWVGNHDRDVKNYDILRSIIKYFKHNDLLKFDIVATSKRDHHKDLFSVRKMVPYYQRLHFLLVLSGSEGTPNPALEAASCGVPVISTYVGNMPDLLKTETGIISSPYEDIYEFARSSLEFILHMNPVKYQNMRKSIRLEIENNWTWDSRSELFKDFLLNW